MIKICSVCKSRLSKHGSFYQCDECDKVYFDEDDVPVAKCPYCDSILEDNDDQFYCANCFKYIGDDSVVASTDDDEDSYSFFDEPDYESMIGNGEEICLNCTYWNVSPYGSSAGMVCNRGNFTEKPDDSCYEFVAEKHFANYGSEGQYQFNETRRRISDKLFHWKNSR